MKRFKVRKTYLLFIFILSVLFITGCGGGGETGHWLLGDTTAPTVTDVVPLNNATGVSINTKVVATFSEAMDPLTITTASFTLTQGGTPVTGAVTYTGVTAVFTPAADLAVNTPFIATITTGAKDLAGNPLASDFVWTFTTGATKDTTAPTVTGTVNANGATDVPINTRVCATFSEAMDPFTFTNVNFTMKETVSGAAVAGTLSYSGVSASFVPTSNFKLSTQYTITVKGGVGGVADLAGNVMASDYVWSWTTGTTADTTAPTVTGTVNANGATDVPINTKVGATFSEAMDHLTVTNVNFTMKETVSGAAVAGTLSYSGVSASFVPMSNLTLSTQYTITVKGGVGGVADLAGNVMESDYVWSWTTGTNTDTTAPTVSSTVPVNNATGVALNSNMTATFSEAMDPLTITNLTFTLTQGGTAVAGVVTYVGLTATFNPDVNLTASTVYTATITTGAKDLAGNALAVNKVWTFTTGTTADTTAPTVSSTVPVNNATRVALNSNITATFSEAMDPLTITNLTFTLTRGGTAVAGAVTMVGLTTTFNPDADLTASTVYTATITTGAKDLAGNALAVNKVWTFTTGATADTTRPTVSSTVPVNNATGVALNSNITATFSEAMDPLTITNLTFTLTRGGTAVAGAVTYVGLTATFNPDVNLTASTLYTATITTGAKDLAGNALAVNKVWTFTTGATADNTRPTVTITNPANGDIGVALNSNMTATFSEAMDPLTITNLTFTLTQGGTAVAGAVTMVGLTATFNPDADLTASTLYTATITTGAEDLAGNALAVNEVWTFTTGAAADNTAPTVTLTSPADLATGVILSKRVTATFSESMDPLTITNLTFTLKQGATVIPGTVTYVGLVATFTPDSNLASNTTYTATVTTGAEDLAGNPLALGAVPNPWTFTTLTSLPLGPAAVDLGTAGDFVLLAKTGISTTGVTTITGDIGVSPAAATFITGFGLIMDSTNTFSTSPGIVTGKVYAASYTAPTPAKMTAAISDLRTAFVDAAGRATPDATELYAGNLSGKTFTPGLYKWSTGISVDAASTVTFNGGANDVWIFQIEGDITMNPGSSVALAGGAQAKNIFWQVGGGTGVTLETTVAMQGIILATKGIVFKSGATLVNGRALAETAVTLIGNTITQPAP